LKDIEKLINKRIDVVDDHAWPLMDHNPVKAATVQRPPRNKTAGNGTNGNGQSRTKKKDRSSFFKR
jgi:ATP-dependent RNA helicase RhlE